MRAWQSPSPRDGSSSSPTRACSRSTSSGPPRSSPPPTRVVADERGGLRRAYEIEVVAQSPEPIMTRTGGYGIAPLKTTAAGRGPIDTLIVAGGWGVHEAVEDDGPGPLDPLGRRPLPPRDLGLLGQLPAGASRAAATASAPPPTGPPARSWRAATPRSRWTRTRSSSTTATSGPRPASPRAWTWRWRWSRRTSAARSRSRSPAGSCSSSSAPAARPSSAPTSRPSSPSATPLRELQGWIADNLDADLRVEVLAERAAMSPRNFARAFRREIGMTPAAYVTELRVERARQRLESGAEPIEPGRRRRAASARPRRCAAPSPDGWASPPPSTAPASAPRPPT